MYIINYQSQTILSDIDNEFLTPIYGEITDVEDEEERVKTPCGHVTGLLIHCANFGNDGARLLDVADSDSQEAYDAICAVFDSDTMEPNHDVSKITEDCPWGNVFIVKELVVHPNHRGQNLGLFTLHDIIKRFGESASIIIIKPYPLQFNAGMTQEKILEKGYTFLNAQGNPLSEAQAIKKLRTHYAKIGFQRVGKTEFFVRFNHLVNPIPQLLEKELVQ